MTLRLAGPYCIIGLGVVGGSLARALRRLDPEAVILGVDPSPEARAAALVDKVVNDALAAPCPAAGSCQLARCRAVFICTPLGALESVLADLQDRLAADAVLTDVIGVKAPVEALIARTLPEAAFVGGHPMAGGERGGFASSRADLFDGRPVALCPGRASGEKVDAVAALWRDLGARPVVLSAAQHDHMVAATSHLPYLAAVALTRLLPDVEPERLAGRGLLDAIRHAGFAPEVMAAVAAANPALPDTARRLAEQLFSLADLAERNPEGLAAAADDARARYSALRDAIG